METEDRLRGKEEKINKGAFFFSSLAASLSLSPSNIWKKRKLTHKSLESEVINSCFLGLFNLIFIFSFMVFLVVSKDLSFFCCC